MTSKWVEVPLEQLKAQTKSAFAMGPFGSKIKAENFTTAGVPVIKGGNLNATYLDESDFDFLTQEKADELESAKARRLDIVITHRGTLGQVGLIPENSKYEEYVVSQSQLKMSFDIKRVDPYFVYYFLKSPLGQSRLLSNVSQVGVPAIAQALTSVRAIEIPIPENRSEQVRISSVLRSLDDKIGLNCGINQTLEAMAQAIFKSWFVDFDPVKAKVAAIEQGQDPLRAAMRAISGKTDAELDQMPREHQDQLATTAALFPDAMEESELGEIPKGWKAIPLSKMIKLIGGGTPKRSEPSYWNGTIPWFSVRDVPDDGDVWVVDTDEKITEVGLQKSSTKLLGRGTTIISARGTVGKLAMVGQEMAMNQSCYGVVGAEGVGHFFNYFNLKLAVETLKRNTHGAVFDTITQATFETVTCVKPENSVMKQFDEIVEPLLKGIRSNVFQSRGLAELRDTLLPKLLSGELSVGSPSEEATA